MWHRLESAFEGLNCDGTAIKARWELGSYNRSAI